jgi:hypothetical protein
MEFPAMYNSSSVSSDLIVSSINIYLRQYNGVQLLWMGALIGSLMTLVFPRLKYGMASMVIASFMKYIHDTIMNDINNTQNLNIAAMSFYEFAMLNMVMWVSLVLYIYLIWKFISWD